MSKTNTDKLVRVDIKTRENLDVISQREQISIKQCVFFMSDFFLKNRVGLQDQFTSPDKAVERVIKIVRAHEKDYLLPILTSVNNIRTFQDRLVIDAAKHLDTLEEEHEQKQAAAIPIQPTSQKQTDDVELSARCEKLTVSNRILVEKLKEMVNENKLTQKNIVGIISYTLKLSEEDLRDIKKTIELCTVQ